MRKFGVRVNLAIAKRSRALFIELNDFDLGSASKENLLSLWNYCAVTALKIVGMKWRVGGSSTSEELDSWDRFCVVRFASGGDPGIFRVKDKRSSAHYLYSPIQSDLGDRWAFVVWKAGAASAYNVRFDRVGWAQCECMGYLAHSHCRHIDAIREILALQGDLAHLRI